MIKILRLLNGEDIIAKLDTSTIPGKIALKNVYRIVLMPSERPGQPPNIGFAPWIPYSKDERIEVKEDHVTAMMEPVPDFVTQYTSITSKLLTPTSRIISGV